MVNPVTGWFEQRQLYGPPNAYVCQQILDSVWLSCYPRPKEIGFDNGSELYKHGSQKMSLTMLGTHNQMQS